MKKIIVLIALLILCTLTACKDGGLGQTNPPTIQVTLNNKEELTLKEFEEVVLYDNENCKAVYKELILDDEKCIIKVELENKTNEELTFIIREIFVNDLTFKSRFNELVAPGSTLKGEIVFPMDEIKANGIRKITKLAAYMYTQYSNQPLLAPVGDGEGIIYPYGEENAIRFERIINSHDQVLCEGIGNLEMIKVENGKNDLYTYIKIYVDNKNDFGIKLEETISKINGENVSSFYAILNDRFIHPGKCGYIYINWSNSDLEKKGITEIKNLYVALEARHALTGEVQFGIGTAIY